MTFEYEGCKVAIDRMFFDTYIVIPERFDPESDLGYTNIHGVPARRHIAHDSGKGLAIVSVYARGDLQNERYTPAMQFSHVNFADGSRCFCECYPREVIVLEAVDARA